MPRTSPLSEPVLNKLKQRITVYAATDHKALCRFPATATLATSIPELTPTIVNEFIKQIIVYAPDKSSGKRTQKVKIVFNFLEEVEVPE